MSYVMDILVCMVIFGTTVYILFTTKKKENVSVGVHEKKLRDRLGEIKMSAEVQMVVSTNVIDGILELYQKENLVVFTPLSYEVLTPNEIIVIPFEEKIKLYQTFRSVRWDPRNFLVVENRGRIPHFHTNQIFFKFKHAHEVDLWYNHTRNNHTEFPCCPPKRTIDDVLVYSTCWRLAHSELEIENFNEKMPLKFLPLFRVEHVRVCAIPKSFSTLNFSFDGCIESDTTVSHISKSSPFVRVAVRILGIPFTLSVQAFISKFHFRVNQKNSHILWAEVLSPQLIGVFVSFGGWICPVLSFLASLVLFVYASFSIGKVNKHELDKNTQYAAPSLFHYKTAHIAFNHLREEEV
ncbi:hypothetical protein EIN_498070 [Entamoeba invadens IP1]|uniref:Uncharacterized protein n=1 Tax=Entamoeba invadens IP1 TaxID=370355 RepID=A0A0A1UDH6_ENTIV|nr:hypothetical protein EIN_498070 [Entamoeba invadens IP1]ELP94617.1 hypothetical protein EIN_498070 [Entamoeba invadens IP1]|eukprot:XP_004261388.1 hypothetical protein EIN_498070 [Entamoeba invadens IP1]